MLLLTEEDHWYDWGNSSTLIDPANKAVALDPTPFCHLAVPHVLAPDAQFKPFSRGARYCTIISFP